MRLLRRWGTDFKLRRDKNKPDHWVGFEALRRELRCNNLSLCFFPESVLPDGPPCWITLEGGATSCSKCLTSITIKAGKHFPSLLPGSEGSWLLWSWSDEGTRGMHEGFLFSSWICCSQRSQSWANHSGCVKIYCLLISLKFRRGQLWSWTSVFCFGDCKRGECSHVNACEHIHIKGDKGLQGFSCTLNSQTGLFNVFKFEQCKTKLY